MKTVKRPMAVAGALMLIAAQAMAGNPRIAATSGHASSDSSYSNLSAVRGQIRATGFENSWRYWFVPFPTNSAGSTGVTVSSRVYGSVSNGTTWNNWCFDSRLCAGTSALNRTGLQDTFSGYLCASGGGYLDTGSTSIAVPQHGSGQTVIAFYNRYDECVVGAGSVAYDGGF